MAEAKFIVRNSDSTRVFDSTDAYPGFPVQAFIDYGGLYTSFPYSDYVGTSGVIVHFSPVNSGISTNTNSGYPTLVLNFGSPGSTRNFLAVLV